MTDYLCDGDRVFTASTGTASSADMNELQDQIKAMLGPRWIQLMSAYQDTSNGSWEFSADTASAGFWTGDTSANQHTLWFPVKLPAGATITDIQVTVFSGAAVSNGSIKLMEISQTTLEGGTPFSWTETQDIAGSDPWDNGTYSYPHTFAQSSLDIVLGDEKQYAIVVTPSDNAGGLENSVYMVRVKYKFGNDD